MTSKRLLHAPPRAALMIEALRGLGYSTATALADIIDNSISAKARNVAITFGWDGIGSHVAILDDGTGMSPKQLLEAMRLGHTNPLDTRAATDLGRFGLGLKTASFSQCRRLTMASRVGGRSSGALRWDLDHLAKAKDDSWHLLEGPAPGSKALLKDLTSAEQGSLVLWECLDRVVSTATSQKDFLDLIDRVESHLAMVFHRYLASARLTIRINGRAIAPWDPFLAQHPATWSSPVETLPLADAAVTVQGHVLPHKDKLDAKIHGSAAGPDGWTAQQGFYVYRNERMLVSGGWLGLGRGRPWTKEEGHRLARLRLDLPNTCDAEWRIDIRKSIARPPVELRERLTLLAEDVRARARRVFAHRGEVQRKGATPVMQAWRAQHGAAGVRYRIDESHPAVRAVLDDAGTLGPDIRAMLRVIEETLPVQRIWLDTAEARETPRQGFTGEDEQQVLAVLEVLYRNMIRRKGMSPTEARARLLATEPFNSHPQLVQDLPDLPSETINGTTS